MALHPPVNKFQGSHHALGTARPLLALGVRRVRLSPCKAYQPTQPSRSGGSSQLPASRAPQQRPKSTSSFQQRAREDPHYDMNFWHYQPWWLQPPAIVLAGLAFMIAALVFDNEPTSKTFVIACGPVVLFWGIFLFLLPRQFKSFAVTYLAEHPDVDKSNMPKR